jgi:hypothetical protein
MKITSDSHDRQARLASLRKRTLWLKNLWEDSAQFEAIVARDGFFKLVYATTLAQEAEHALIEVAGRNHSRAWLTSQEAGGALK